MKQSLQNKYDVHFLRKHQESQCVNNLELICLNFQTTQLNILFYFVVYSDRESHKPGIFERLSIQETEEATNEPSAKIKIIDKYSTSSSIFSRLGNKSEESMESSPATVSGILRSPSEKEVSI